MKKLLMLLLVFAFVGFIASPVIASPTGTPDGWVPSAKGEIYDINRDGKFNYADIKTFEFCWGHKKGDNGWRCYTNQRPAGAPYFRADLNYDGKVDFKDLMNLSKYVNWYQINGWWK